MPAPRTPHDPYPLVERQVGYSHGKEIISHLWHDHWSAVRIARLLREFYHEPEEVADAVAA